MAEHPRDRMARIFNCEPLGTKMAQEILDDYLELKLSQVEKVFSHSEFRVTWQDVVNYLRNG